MVGGTALMAENLPECKSDEDKIKGCVEKAYYYGGNPANYVGNHDGLSRREIPYKNDKTNGIGKLYYENGNLMTEILYKNDEMVGMQKGHMPNGNYS